jgi:hypothetical protein
MFGAVPMPDGLHKTYLEVRRRTSWDVITVLELLSASNKQPGRGRRLYLRQRQRVLPSPTHLVEIDLCPGGTSMPIIAPAIRSDYRILASRSDGRPDATLYPFGLWDPIPAFSVPLHGGATEPRVDLEQRLMTCYGRAAYHLRIDYRLDAIPPLRADDRDWACALVAGGK